MSDKLIVKIKLCHPQAQLPTKAHSEDEGWDLVALEVQAKSNWLFFFDTGLQIEPPIGYYSEVCPRSSLSKTDFIQANSLGIIDNGYRGNILIPLRYIGVEDGLAAAKQLIGKRIAQLILRKSVPVELKLASQLAASSRDKGGFGSSGS